MDDLIQNAYDAIEMHDLEKVKTILAPLDSFSSGHLDGRGYKLITFALEEKTPEVAKFLLENAPNVDFKYKLESCDTPLLPAAENGYTEIVSMLLDRNSDTNVVDVVDKYGMTPLHYAAAYDNLEIVKLLISRNASIYAQTMSGWTPILEAIHAGNDEVIKEIYNHGVKVDQAGYTRWVDEKCTSLHLAVFQQDASLVDLSLLNGVDVNAVLSDGTSALFLATILKDSNIVKLLLERGANIHSRDAMENTVLHYAARTGCIKVLEVVLAGKPTVEVYNKVPESPVAIAVKSNHTAILKILLENGGHVEDVFCLGFNAVEVACIHGHTEIFKFLVEITGCLQPNSSIAAYELLQFACSEDVPKIVETLLTMGADLKIKDEKGATVLHIAASFSNSSVVRVLLNHGADVNATDDQSQTPIDLINCTRNPPMFKTTVKIFSEHVLTMLSRDLYVSEETLEAMDYYNERIGFTGNLQSEVARMKTKKIGESTVSFNDIVRGNIHQLMNYARNDNIVKILESDELNKDFPISSNVMKRNIKEGQNQLNLMHSSRESLIRLIGYDVPDVVTNEIGQYFSNNDLRNIIDADDGDDVDSKEQEDVIA